MDERMEEAQRGFLRHLAAKGYSQEIVNDYGEDLEVFLTFLTAQGAKDLKAVGETHLRAYGEWVEGARNFRTKEPLSFRTKASRIRTVKRFFRWMEWTGWVLVDSSGVLKAPPRRNQTPKVMTVGEVEKLLSAPEGTTLGGIRSRAILEVWYGAGLWAEEMEGLTLADVEGGAGLFLEPGTPKAAPRLVASVQGAVRTSGRVIPLEERVVFWLENYLKEVRPKWVLGSEPTQALWVSPSGGGMTRVALWQVVKRFANRVGLGGVGFSGKLRGSRAAHWLMEDVSCQEVGRRLGVGKDMVEKYATAARRLKEPKEAQG